MVQKHAKRVYVATDIGNRITLSELFGTQIRKRSHDALSRQTLLSRRDILGQPKIRYAGSPVLSTSTLAELRSRWITPF